MDIPYKFRGIDEDGNFHYGDLVQCRICMIMEDYAATKVLPQSVSQLVGYDVDGKEIYEGDTLVDKDGNIWDKLEIYSDVDNAFTVQKYKLRLIGRDFSL